jgi:hypothetical protein
MTSPCSNRVCTEEGGPTNSGSTCPKALGERCPGGRAISAALAPAIWPQLTRALLRCRAVPTCCNQCRPAVVHSTDDDVTRPFVPVTQASALEQLYDGHAEVVADAPGGTGGTQGEAVQLCRCDDDGELADDFFVALAGGHFKRARSNPLPARPRL